MRSDFFLAADNPAIGDEVKYIGAVLPEAPKIRNRGVRLPRFPNSEV